MTRLEGRPPRARSDRSLRRPRRLVIAALTATVVIAAAIALTLLVSPPGGLAPTTEPARSPVTGRSVGAGPTATASSSFPRPAASPSAATPVPALPTSSPATGAPTARRVGTEAIRIRMERLGIDLPIIEGDGVDAPFYKAAHYPGTAWPGGGSNIYIYGHAQEGMFLTLWQARVGDEIVLDLVDGTQAGYVISKVIPEARWNELSLLAPTPTEQLTVQTSTSNTETAPRFVVIAVPKAAA